MAWTSLIVLLCLVVGAALYDARTRRVPNWVTLPLLLAGLLCHFPGAAPTWLGCGLLFLAWRGGWLGGGDAKLWMALLWWAPSGLAAPALGMMGLALAGSAVIQIAWRASHGQPTRGVRSPGAWRAIPFVLLLSWYVH